MTQHDKIIKAILAMAMISVILMSLVSIPLLLLLIPLLPRLIPLLIRRVLVVIRKKTIKGVLIKKIKIIMSVAAV